ncbi:MAG: undecaprenyl-phosphate glucose phosphotransferase [Bacteroidota bacterium]|nr:undecaprenyl-phosphate glucose phosphotransferase [Bacteroidota bacterium]
MLGNYYSNKVKFIRESSDLVFLNLAFFITSLISKQSFSFTPHDQTFSFLIMINLIWFVLAINTDLYKMDLLVRIDKNVYKLFFVVILNYIVVSLILYLSHIFKYSARHLFVFYFLAYYLILAEKKLFLLVLKNLRQRGYNIRNVVILGSGKVGEEIKSHIMADYSFGYKYLGAFDDKPNIDPFKTPLLGTLNDFKSFALKNKVDIAFIALPESAYSRISELMQFCDANTIRAKIIPDFMLYIRYRIKLDYYGNIPIILLHDEPLDSFWNRFIKRIFDIVFSLSVILFILSWLIPVLGILIKIDSKGPVFFIQRRTGLNNYDFDIIKFRTMFINANANTKTTRKNDSRITRLGSFLRRTNIDELPQFINVLKGDMSIIGPRPHMFQETIYYSKIIDSYLVRHFVKPGITGWAQVNGLHGNTNIAIMKRRIKHDIYYIENWSVVLDIRILFKTVKNMYEILFVSSKSNKKPAYLNDKRAVNSKEFVMTSKNVS